MSDESREREFLAQARSALDASVEAIDPATRTRLRAARTSAIDAPRKPRRWLPVAGLVAATSAAAVAIAVWRVGSPTGGPESVAPAPVPVPIAATPNDSIPVAAAEDLDLFLDLDFYTWLAEDGDAG